MTDSNPQNEGMPFSDDAERGLISCILQNPDDLLDDVASDGVQTWIYHPVHRTIVELALEFHALDDKPLDLVTFSQFAIDKGKMDKIGGPGFLAELTNFIPTPTHYPFYKGIIRDKWLLRRMIDTGNNLISRAREYQENVLDGLMKSESDMFELIDAAQSADIRQGGLESAGTTLHRWSEHIEATFRNRGKVSGITTGINDLDRTLHGLDDSEGEQLVIAARPGMGKTALATSIIEHLVDTRTPTAFFPIEMGTNRTWSRIILGNLGIDGGRAYDGMFSRADMQRMADYATAHRDAPLFMDNSPALNTAELRHRVKTAKRKHGIRCLVIDYLGLVQPVTDRGLEQERLKLEEVMSTAHWLKRKYKLAVIMLVQLNRETDRSAGKPPVLADLSGSASIEQFADHVVFIHRPEYYFPWAKLDDKKKEAWNKVVEPLRSDNPGFWADTDEQDYKEHALLYVRKNRRGPTPDLPVRFIAQLTRFSSRTPALYSNDPGKRQATYQGSRLDEVFGGDDEN